MGALLDSFIANNRVFALSGEGETGTYTEISGVKTVQGLKKAIKKETSGGDRWAKVIIYDPETKEAWTFNALGEVIPATFELDWVK